MGCNFEGLKIWIKLKEGNITLTANTRRKLLRSVKKGGFDMTVDKTKIANADSLLGKRNNAISILNSNERNGVSILGEQHHLFPINNKNRYDMGTVILSCCGLYLCILTFKRI
jgi:hypothetical protein